MPASAKRARRRSCSMSSRDRDRRALPANDDDMPKALPSMWRLVKLGYRSEPALMGVALGFSLLSALPDALLAWWFKVLGDGIIEPNSTKVRVAIIGLAAFAVATWFLRTVSTRVQRRFRD